MTDRRSRDDVRGACDDKGQWTGVANIVARMERSAIRDSRDAGPGLRGACHRAPIRATRWLRLRTAWHAVFTNWWRTILLSVSDARVQLNGARHTRAEIHQLDRCSGDAGTLEHTGTAGVLPMALHNTQLSENVTLLHPQRA